MDHNDNDMAANPLHRPDAHGQAAMLLVESLLHGLIDRRVLSVADAVEIVGVASDVQGEIAYDLDLAQLEHGKSLALLDAIGRSLEGDPHRV